ncbi:ABC transporter ATP-binding protein [Pseudonocardia sichuanensis]|uniref:ATP-binding cassette subfamily B protein n=1 Tax=Pseudonocardia kunmingensis TaxID=630975 RepID=A0A543D9P1_9PSEU|nr:ABC transporter ATP-binding protein [Pseudonocardia kunmingensis]TQM06063.1 ATP-binding cassette subfamily B protein [Pseudonocardia kunmingensis]
MLDKLMGLLGPQKAHLLRSHLVLSALWSIAQGLTIALAVPAVTHLLAGDPVAALPWLAAVGAGAICSWVLHHVSTLRGFDAAIELLSTLRHRIGDHVATLPLGWFTPARTGRLGHLLSAGVMDIFALPVRQLSALVQATVTPLVLTIAVAVFEPRLALVVAAALPLVAGAYWWSGRLGRHADAAVDASAAHVTDRMVEFARNQTVLRAFGRAGTGLDQFDQALLAQQRAERRQLWMVLPPLIVNGSIARLLFLGLLATVTSVAVGAQTPAQVGTAVALLVVVNRIVEPLSEVAAHGTTIRMATAQLDTVEAILTSAPLQQPATPAPTPARTDIELRRVRFAYQPGRPVVDDVSLSIPEGSMTALVGASGSGKTTITRLIARFWDTTDGQVLIGGVDVRDLHTEQLMSLIAPVFQDTYLFSGILLDNLRIARPTASDDDIERAAATARVTEIVERLPHGWRTPVGEGGARLSGGERQRVALARALVKDAPIMLLDEATSALDAVTQAAVSAGLLAVRRRRTMLVIAHQLATIVDADQIVVLDHGQVVEHGTHEELLAMNRRYAAFWRARTAAQGWRLTRG